jgi:hypothetical protein
MVSTRRPFAAGSAAARQLSGRAAAECPLARCRAKLQFQMQEDDQKVFQPKKEIICLSASVTRGRCYDHNCLQFLTIFGEKIGVFLKYQCYDQLFSKFSFVLSQKRQFFSQNFSAKIFEKS